MFAAPAGMTHSLVSRIIVGGVVRMGNNSCLFSPWILLPALLIYCLAPAEVYGDSEGSFEARPERAGDPRQRYY